MAFAIADKKNPVPPYKVNFQNDTYSNNFTQTLTQTLLSTSIVYLGVKIEEINNKMKGTVDRARTLKGYASKSAGDARKELNHIIIEEKEKYEHELLKFKTNMKCKQHKSSARDNGKRKDRPKPY